MPYFAAAYCGARALPRTITVEPMLTIDPPPSCSSMREPNSCVHISVPLMSTARVWSIDSSVMSRHDICSLAMSPTLLIATSSRPKRSHTASAIRLICAQSVMSACTTNALRPSASTRAAVRRAPSAELR